MPAFLHAQWSFVRHLCKCMLQGSALPCIVCSYTCGSACVEPVLVSLCSQQSSVVHMRVDPSCCSAILRSSIVSGLFLPSPSPFFPLYILYQCDRCPVFPSTWDSWLGCQDLPAMGAVSSRSWLPIVEAPGCLGHSTSI